MTRYASCLTIRAKMHRSPSVSIKAVRICLLAAHARGVAVDPAELGLGPELADPTARVPHALVARLWVELPERAGDACFGLHAAELVQGHALDVVDYATRTCRTLRESLTTLIRYSRLVHDAYDIRLEEDGTQARYTVRFDCQPPMPRQLLEFILSSWVLRVRRGIDGECRVRELQLPHAPPGDLSEHRRILGVPLRFGAPCAAVVFDRAMLDAPSKHFEPELNAVLARQAEDMLAARADVHDGQPELLARLRRQLSAALPQGNATIGEIARRLGMSGRSLQRRLQEHGASFADVVDVTRRQLALEHLVSDDRTLCEVAFLTGFSDASAFTRAFRRWTGETPGAYRLRSARAPQDLR